MLNVLVEPEPVIRKHLNAFFAKDSLHTRLANEMIVALANRPSEIHIYRAEIWKLISLSTYT